MAKSVFALGVVGGAPNSAAGYAHFVSSQMDGLWKICAGVFSRDPDTNLQAGMNYGVSSDRVYSSLQDLLINEAGNLDAILILTPTNLHYEMVEECLRVGLPVICEKALAQTSQEAFELKKLCEDRNRFLAVVYNYSGYPMVREMRHMIRSEILGDVLHFQAEMPQEGYLRTNAEGQRTTPQDWRLKDGAVPKIHLDLAIHLHELIFYLIGQEPLEVVADQSSFGWFDVIDNASFLSRYPDQIRGQFWFSKSALGSRNGLRLRIYGTKASAEWYQLNPEEILLSHADGRREIVDRGSDVKVASQKRYNRFKVGHPAGFNEALANLYVDIHEALVMHQSGETFRSKEVFGADLALGGLRFLEAASRSVATRQWEKVAND